MPENDMLKEIWEEIRYVRRKLDDHIDDEGDTLVSIRGDLTKIKEEITAHKTKIGMISGGLSMFVAAMITWIFHIFSGQ